MKKLLVATTNLHKLNEINAIFSETGLTGWQLLSLKDYPEYEAPEEDGESFAENAVIKAVSAAKMSGLLTLADDSGLVVEALGGAPGIHSARYAAGLGGDHDDAANRAKLIGSMSEITDSQRAASFVCVAALATANSDAIFIEGRCDGMITHSEKGEGGFGYDSLFYLPDLKKTMAELQEQEKNDLSHRGQAMRKIADLLNSGCEFE